MNSDKKNIIKAAVIGGGFQFAFVLSEYAAWSRSLSCLRVFGADGSKTSSRTAFRRSYGC